MPVSPDSLIKPFEQAAEAAHRAEAGYAKQFEAELARHKREREFAFRRLGLVTDLLKAANVEDGDAAIAAQTACLRNELGWHEVSAAKDRIVEEFKTLAAVIHAHATAPKKPRQSIAEAFTAFETWYARETGSPFLALFDQEIPEMPVVDF